MLVQCGDVAKDGVAATGGFQGHSLALGRSVMDHESVTSQQLFQDSRTKDSTTIVLY
jgi:hypothetical protein